MDSKAFLTLAVALIVAGFVILAAALRAWHDPLTRPRVKRHSGPIALAIVVLSLASALSFWNYTLRSRAEGIAARTQIFDKFAQAPRIARLANAGLRPVYDNDDAIELDGTTSLMVTLSPSGAFSAQFPAWRSGKKQRPVDKLWVKMRIDAPGFDVSPVLDETQSVPGDVMTFAWILRGRQSGDQMVDISAIAFRQTAAGQIYDRATVVNSMRSIWVKPAFPLETWTAIVTTLITVLLGGSLPFVIQSLTDARAKNRDQARVSQTATAIPTS